MEEAPTPGVSVELPKYNLPRMPGLGTKYTMMIMIYLVFAEAQYAFMGWAGVAFALPLAYMLVVAMSMLLQRMATMPRHQLSMWTNALYVVFVAGVGLKLLLSFLNTFNPWWSTSMFFWLYFAHRLFQKSVRIAQSRGFNVP